MDEDSGDSGLSGWGWFQLGEMSSDYFRSLSETADLVASRLSGQTQNLDANALAAENQQLQALQAELQRVQAHNTELRAANQSLYKWYEWAKDAKKTLAQRKAELAELRASNAALQQAYDAVVKLYDDLGHNYGKQFDQLTDLQKTVEKLRRGES
jgi:septation ring formation regulator EzrA